MTHGKYEITTVPDRGSMYVIKPKGKGSVPKGLRGMYTSPQEAIRAIENYKGS